MDLLRITIAQGVRKINRLLQLVHKLGRDVRDNRLTSQTLAVNVNFVRERLENGFSSDSKLARVFMQIPSVNPSLKVNLPRGITHYPT